MNFPQSHAKIYDNIGVAWGRDQKAGGVGKERQVKRGGLFLRA
jgi:hypothetical protein